MALQDQFDFLRGEKQQTPSDLLDNTRIVVHRGLTMPFVRDDLLFFDKPSIMVII